MENGETKTSDAGATGNAGVFSLHEANRTNEQPVDNGDSVRKRGRPPGSKNRNRSMEIPGDASRNSARVSNPADIEAAKLLGAGLVSLVELAETFVHSGCETKIAKHRPEKLDEFKELAARLGLQTKDGEIISSSMQQIALRHEWMTKWAPEVMLSLTLSQYSLRQLHLMRFVNNVIVKPAPAKAESLGA